MQRISARFTRIVRIWNANTGQQRSSPIGSGSVLAVAFAPDGSWLATGDSDNAVRIWDATTGQQRMRLTGHSDWVDAVAIAPDGTWLATGGRDNLVQTWDATTGENVWN